MELQIDFNSGQAQGFSYSHWPVQWTDGQTEMSRINICLIFSLSMTMLKVAGCSVASGNTREGRVQRLGNVHK